eukprot:TRINITY_DN11056_c0_g1_i1.p1 TRINITY_DN11056_c0_g1~~TRINITY_DN11056_c0_g1_i1.p1  ORF type:complete len:181 (+),score=22.95 TRINITY_DN11056_c0_g1_i1:59-544(+)
MAVANVPVEELYELCVKNGFIDDRPVVARGLPRSKSAPDITVSSSCLKVPKSNTDVELTLMLKNIPCKVTEERIESLLIEHGFGGSYDYVYCPTRLNGSNLGYAFVNFIERDDAHRFEAVFSGYQFSGINSAKQCYVTKAAIQGREANVRMNARYRRMNIA